MEIDPLVEPYFDVSFVLGTFVFCARCRCEAVYTSPHPQFTDENYYDQAIAMKEQGWVITESDPLDVLCPKCAKESSTERRPPLHRRVLARLLSMFHHTRPEKLH